MAVLEVTPEECIIIEDSENGVKAGMAAEALVFKFLPLLQKNPEKGSTSNSSNSISSDNHNSMQSYKEPVVFSSFSDLQITKAHKKKKS